MSEPREIRNVIFCQIEVKNFYDFFAKLLSETCWDKNNFGQFSRSDVCMLGILDANISLARAGAVAQYVQGIVIFCGGQSLKGIHRDCLMYNPKADSWANFTELLKKRDEASIANAGNITYIIGGSGEKTTEYIDMKTFSLDNVKHEDSEENTFIPKSRQKSSNTIQNLPEWRLGPSLPQIRARACAVAIGSDKILLIGGHDNSSLTPLSSTYQLDVDGGKWREAASMIEPRKDHACLYVELETTDGVLVTGGLDSNGQVLHTAEFYDIKEKKWTQISSMKIGRTEHTMALIYGIPTVIGGWLLLYFFLFFLYFCSILFI